MKVKIKTIKEFENDKSIIAGNDWANRKGFKSKKLSWWFVKDMNKYCGKIFNVKKDGDFTYKIINNYINKVDNWAWCKWMFEVLPEKDKNGNYLLELGE